MTYSVQEVETHIVEILRRVREGERIVVAEEGREVAEIRPLTASQGEDLRDLQERGTSESSFSQRWRGQFRPADRKEERYRALAKRYL